VAGTGDTTYVAETRCQGRDPLGRVPLTMSGHHMLGSRAGSPKETKTVPRPLVILGALIVMNIK